MNIISVNYPDFYPKYQKLYGNNNKYGHLDYDAFKEMNLVWPELRGYKYGYELGLGYTAERYVPEGRIKSNLKISELLRKIAFLKGSIMHDSRFVVQNYGKAANFMEKTQRDISELDEEDFESMPVPSNTKPIIKEFALNGSSNYLKDLEKKAYDKVIDRYYS